MIEQFFKKNDVPEEFRKSGNVREELNILKNKIRSTQLELNSVVSSSRDIVTIALEDCFGIEILPMSNYIAKIDTKGHRGPLKINIEMVERSRGDTKISVHTKVTVS